MAHANAIMQHSAGVYFGLVSYAHPNTLEAFLICLEFMVYIVMT